MSAQWDQAQGLRFYFGNAYKDLGHLLPPDDEIQAFSSEPTEREEIAVLIDLVDHAQAALEQIKILQKNLSFIVSDLTRTLK